MAPPSNPTLPLVITNNMGKCLPLRGNQTLKFEVEYVGITRISLHLWAV
jgi:hypothetical protein